MNELDEALRRIHDCSFEYGGGRTNRAATVVGALDALGHKALIEAFLDVYLPRLDMLEMGTEIPTSDQAAAMGSAPAEDWLKTLEVDLGSLAWSDLLRQRLPELIKGALAAGLSAPSRLSQAVRNLCEEDSSERRSELVFSLAYWSSNHSVLPASAGRRAEKGWTPSRVLASLEEEHAPLPVSENLTDALKQLEESTVYCESLERADLETIDHSGFISELCAEAAGHYLQHPDHGVAYAHGMIAASGFRHLFPYLDSAQTTSALGSALQCVSAVHALYGHTAKKSDRDGEVDRLAESWDEMRYRAACSLAEDVIELTEVCWREDTIRPDDRFRLAAADAILTLGFSRGGRGG